MKSNDEIARVIQSDFSKIVFIDTSVFRQEENILENLIVDMMRFVFKFKVFNAWDFSLFFQ
jgi:hypothetical protein